MGILEHKPFFFGIVASLFALVGLFVGFEVYRMPFILRTLQNVGNGISRQVIGSVRRRVPRCPACLLKMDCRRYDFILFQNTGDLRRPLTVQTKGKYPLDDFGSFGLFVLRVFHISIGRVVTEMFLCFPFGLHHSADYLACVFGVPLIDDAHEEQNLLCVLICMVP